MNQALLSSIYPHYPELLLHYYKLCNNYSEVGVCLFVWKTIIEVCTHYTYPLAVWFFFVQQHVWGNSWYIHTSLIWFNCCIIFHYINKAHWCTIRFYQANCYSAAYSGQSSMCLLLEESKNLYSVHTEKWNLQIIWYVHF